MLLDVLTQVSADTGIHPVQKRTTLIELLNKAGLELQKELDSNAAYRECTLVVSPDKVVSLPPFIGILKGVRMHSTELPVDIHSMSSPRYVTNTLGYQYKNWRDVGSSPVAQLPQNTGPITLQVSDLETPPVVITVAGETANSAALAELIILDATVKSSINLFTQNLTGISCRTRVRTFDITVKDSDGNEIAKLYNNQPKTRYKLIDVSKVFWPYDTTIGESLIDILFKPPYRFLDNDTDSFPAGDEYDEPWYNMCMYFHFLPIENRTAQAMMHRANALDFCKSAKENEEGAILKKMSFGRNKFYDHFGRRVPTNWNQSLDYYNK